MHKSVWGQAGSDVEAGVDLSLRGQCLATLLNHKVYIPQPVVLADWLQYKLFID